MADAVRTCTTWYERGRNKKRGSMVSKDVQDVVKL